MSPYPLRTLGDILELSLDEQPTEPTGTYKIAGVYSFGRGLFGRGLVSGLETSYKRFHRLHTGHLVVSRLKAFEGAVAVVEPAFSGWYLSQEFPTFKPHPTRLDAAYLRHLCRWPTFWFKLRENSRGIGARRERVHPQQLFEIKLPIPGIAEQRRVARKLDRLSILFHQLDSRSAQAEPKRIIASIPVFIDRILAQHAVGLTKVGELAQIVSDTIHPGDDFGKARSFVGLQHIESHTGRSVGELPIGDETGRKFRFRPGDVLYGYLRPYLNKVWVADRHGLCSVDQYVLRPRRGVGSEILGYLLRSSRALNQAIELTHSLQLPRLRSNLLLGLEVIKIDEQNQRDATQELDQLVDRFIRMADLRRRQQKLAQALGKSALNQAFAGLL